ncbi:hypothetical protein L323_15575 [Ruminiclostridium papyrosolvens C7]|uniref:Uncharacterized protein n=1 Tax=Ruminiclostridium papyrosolvens C7 TaxID=1330534 RepID=U4QZN1_9FIRM|nr:hypothetical protein L323_15575 [Ruminiclostridium papyrosolvens C7]
MVRILFAGFVTAFHFVFLFAFLLYNPKDLKT